jgi:SpoVK/Ycf46/Vps4 family AAA+-type ATPase
MAFLTRAIDKSAWYKCSLCDCQNQICFLGYEEQFKVGTSIAANAAKGNTKLQPRSLLFFGIPGNGKTLFPKALVQRLNEQMKLKFSLTMVVCDLIPTETGEPAQIIRGLDEIMQESQKNEPVIICFDEVDLLCPDMSEVSAKRSPYSAWMRRLLKHDRFKNKTVLIVGITNYPSCIDLSVKRNFGLLVYFEPTPIDIVKKIIHQELAGSTRKAKLVAERYMNDFREVEMRPMGAETTMACRILKENYQNIDTMSVDDVVTILKASTPIAPTELEIQMFESKNRNLIDYSRKCVLPHWLKIHEDLMKTK